MAEKKAKAKKRGEEKPKKKPVAKRAEKKKPKPKRAVEKKKPKPKTAKEKEPEKKPAEKEPKERKPPEKKPKEEKEAKEKLPAKKPAEEKPKEKPKEEEPKKKPKEKKPKHIEKIKSHKTRELSDGEKRLLKKKPRFVRQELYKLKKLKDKWRKPGGIDSKKHEGKRGKGKVPSIGYKKPKIVSGLECGHRPSIVQNPKELEGMSQKDVIIISKSVGRKKRNEIIKSANEKNIIVLNPRKGEI